MLSQLRTPWLNRLFCGLLTATIIAPEVRCCCNISWGSAGFFQLAAAIQKPAGKARCCRRASQAADDREPSHGFQSCDEGGCRCTFRTASVAPSSSAFDQEFAPTAPGLILVWLPSEVRDCILNDQGIKPHPPSLTAIQCCARLQSWQT